VLLAREAALPTPVCGSGAKKSPPGKTKIPLTGRRDGRQATPKITISDDILSFQKANHSM
jgi:hypothetical protein